MDPAFEARDPVSTEDKRPGEPAELARKPRPARQARRFHAGQISFRSPRLDARLVNLSTIGAAIETSDPPRIGAEVLCELETEQSSALIPGQVRWCRLGSTASDEAGDVIPVYRAGIQFLNSTPGNLLRILRSAGLHRTNGQA